MTSASVSTSGDVCNTISGTFNILTSGSTVVIQQIGDTYGTSSISMMNRVGQNGFVVSTANTTTTLVDFALQNGAASSTRSVRHESPASIHTTGQHSLPFG
jgi:hypothetical protein